MNDIKILSFFTGAGFMDLGFHLSDFVIVHTNEISSEISKVYNSGMSSFIGKKVEISSNKSVEEFTSTDIEKIKEEFEIDDLWGIIGGPPCPDFSTGGKNKGHKGDNGKLTETYVNLICDVKPSFFVLENVKGLFKTKKHRVFFDEMITRLENADYAIDYRVLNALELGIPQDRERIFVFGVRLNIYKSIFKIDYNRDRNWFFWPYYEKYNGAKEKYHWPSTIEFGRTPEKPSDIPDELMVGSYIINQEELNHVANSEEYFNPKSNKFETVEEGNDNGKSFKRLHRWRYSPTVAYGNNEVHLHPSLPRRLSVREAMRLQTVPDSYIISRDITLTIKFKAIGNGVPVKMATLLAGNIKSFLNIYQISRR